MFIILFLHQTTTTTRITLIFYLLFIILFLHQTTTWCRPLISRSCCLSSCSYIKPQHLALLMASVIRCLSSCSYIKPQRLDNSCYRCCVVYHLVPTSNHNLAARWPLSNVLFIILFLHQTTTGQTFPHFSGELFIILFLHQTTTYSRKSTGNQ